MRELSEKAGSKNSLWHFSDLHRVFQVMHGTQKLRATLQPCSHGKGFPIVVRRFEVVIAGTLRYQEAIRLLPAVP
jgi:hypothetical protein